MTRRQDAAKLVKDGMSPSDVAASMRLSTATVRLYLLEQIAEGQLMRSDIVRHMDAKTKENYEAYIATCEPTDYWSLVNGSRGEGLDTDEFRLYLDCRDALRGDLYTYISRLEIFLHERVRTILIAEFGADEVGWWRNGVPEQIRRDCASSREADPYPPGEPYTYTTFIHLAKIIDKNWRLFSASLPRDIAADRKVLGEIFDRLNAIRNAVMHPVKRVAFSDDDFMFVEAVLGKLGDPRRWQK